MDAVTGLLNGPAREGAFLLRSILDPPWSMPDPRTTPRSPLIAVLQRRRPGWFPTGRTRRLRPAGWRSSAAPSTTRSPTTPPRPPTVIIHPGQFSTTMDGEELCEAMDSRTADLGRHGSAGSVTMLTGTYQSPSEISRLLLGALPPVIVRAEDGWDGRFLTLLSDEMRNDEPGQEVVLDRLLDLVLIAALRAWSAGPDADRTRRAIRSGMTLIVSAALRLMHDDPARPWTVASLAAACRRLPGGACPPLHRLMGMPPMAYLTRWRLALAADLLREPAATIAIGGPRCRLWHAFALSTAFKRIRGVSPRDHRLITAG